MSKTTYSIHDAIKRGSQTDSRLKHKLIMFWMWWQEKFHGENWDE